MRNFILTVFWGAFFLMMPFRAEGAGSLELSLSESYSSFVEEMFLDNVDYRFLAVELKASAEEDILLEQIKFDFVLSEGGSLGAGSIIDLRLLDSRGTILDNSARPLPAGGGITFLPDLIIPKSSSVHLYVQGKIARDARNKIFNVKIYAANVLARGRDSGQWVGVTGSATNYLDMKVKGGFPDLVIQDWTWQPDPLRAFDLEEVWRDSWVSPEEEAEMETDFKVRIKNQGDARVDMKKVILGFYQGSLANRIYEKEIDESSILEPGAEKEYTLTLGYETHLRDQISRKSYFFKVDASNIVDEDDEDNNELVQDLVVRGEERISLTLSDLSLGSSIFQPEKEDIAIAEYKMIGAENQFGIEVNGMDLILEGCGNTKAIQNIRIVDKSDDSLLGTVSNFNTQSIASFSFDPPLLVAPFKYYKFRVFVDLKQACPEAFKIGVRSLEVDANQSQNDYPVFSNEMKTEQTVILKDFSLYHLQVEQSVWEMASRSFEEPVQNVELGVFDLFSSDSPSRYFISGLEIKASDCFGSISNLRLVDHATNKILGSLSALSKEGIGWILFDSPVQGEPVEKLRYILKGDMVAECGQGMKLGINQVQTELDVTEIDFPVWSNTTKASFEGLPVSSEQTTTQEPGRFAYGKARVSLELEWRKAVELKQKLQEWFNRDHLLIPARFWHRYVNAYIYGGYPIQALGRYAVLGGKTVHAEIPWSAWRNCRDYRDYIAGSY